MAKLSNIRGMLLEESLLRLLESSGYKTIEAPGVDPTLIDGPAGMKVKGRGGDHQIDAIADFQIAQPFSHPQRLLVEAKCFDPQKNVGLPIVREAVGILKDVGEYWMVAGGEIPKQRYHYQFALFSATGYTRDAQRYAFAQDIFLIPLAASRFFQNVIRSIRNIRPARLGADENADIQVEMRDLRALVRRHVRETAPAEIPLEGAGESVDGLNDFIRSTRVTRTPKFRHKGREMLQ